MSFIYDASTQTNYTIVYVFETLVDNQHDDIIDKFRVPACFTALPSLTGCHIPMDKSDLLSAAGSDGLGFGLHRWLLIGPTRSGSNMHVDPLGLSLSLSLSLSLPLSSLSFSLPPRPPIFSLSVYRSVCLSISLSCFSLSKALVLGILCC